MKPVPYYVLALAMAVPAILVGVELPTLFRFEDLALHSNVRGFWTAGYMLRTGQRKDLYDLFRPREVVCRSKGDSTSVS